MSMENRCTVCGSYNVIPVQDENMSEEQILSLCLTCFKNVFGNPPVSDSMMYT